METNARLSAVREGYNCCEYPPFDGAETTPELPVKSGPGPPVTEVTSGIQGE